MSEENSRSEGDRTTDYLSIPGPWRLDDASNSHVLEDNDGYHIIEGGGERGDSDHFRLTGFIPLDVARLIAAAPDLLAALKNIRISHQTGHNESEAWLWVNAAIDKAEGRP